MLKKLKRWSNQQTGSHYISFILFSTARFSVPLTSISSSKAPETHVFVVILAPLYCERQKLYKCGFLQTYSVIWWLISIEIIIRVGIICHLLFVRTRQKSSSERFKADGGWRTRKANDVCVHIWTLLLKVMSAFISISVRGRCVRMADDVCAYMWTQPNYTNLETN